LTCIQRDLYRTVNALNPLVRIIAYKKEIIVATREATPARMIVILVRLSPVPPLWGARSRDPISLLVLINPTRLRTIRGFA